MVDVCEEPTALPNSGNRFQTKETKNKIRPRAPNPRISALFVSTCTICNEEISHMQSSSRLQDACTPGLAAEKFLNLNTDEYSGACCSGHGLAGILLWWVPPLKFHAQRHGHGVNEERNENLICIPHMSHFVTGVNCLLTASIGDCCPKLISRRNINLTADRARLDNLARNMWALRLLPWPLGGLKGTKSKSSTQLEQFP
jgi:hypothetical protein